MVCIAPDDLHLDNAIEATKSLFLRELPEHVCVGPMPPGALNALELPLKDLDVSSPSIKHFIDLITDLPKAAIDLPSLQAIFRDKAWDELPELMKPKERPAFEMVTQYFLLPHADENFYCLLKHMYICNDKIPAIGAQRLCMAEAMRLHGVKTTRKLCARLSKGCWSKLVEPNLESIL